ncbi:MAG: sigma-70 family RNA polymerase sigma factor [Planctomycetales bacterium]|nr:sigma-70 family RNA polymerase sigma factor [Planctomycetales bacterium]
MNANTSLTLLGRMKANDHQAWLDFEKLYSRLIRYTLAKSWLSNEEIEDLEQDVKIVVSQRLKSFEHNGRPGALRTWLRQIAVYHLKSYGRRQSRRPDEKTESNSYLQAAAELDNPHSVLTQLWHKECAAAVLDSVEDRYGSDAREILYRRAVLNQPVREVAEFLRLEEGAVRNRQSRIMKFLRETGLED